MKKRHSSWMALLLATAFLASLAGCGTAASSAASTEGNAAQTAEAATSETTAADGQGIASEAQSDESAPPDPEGAATFSYAQCEEAALRAQQYWYADMTTGPGAYRYAVVDSVAASVLDYDMCSGDGDLRAMLTYPSEAPTILDRIYDGEGMLVQVHFYVEYESEYNYLGPQYGDGACYVYIFVPVDAARPCETVSGWYSAQLGERMPRPGQTTMAEGLTVPQSRMLLHQCRALAAAGLREFSSPEDWSEEQTYRYLYHRGQDYGYGEEEWQQKTRAANCANRLLTIDFTTGDDWYSNQRFFGGDWPGFDEQQRQTWQAGMDSGAVPGYRGLHTAWQFGWDGDTLVAKMQSENGVALQEYRFLVYDGFAGWDGRTYCIGGRSLA